MPRTRSGYRELPAIAPASLTRAQRSGRRCAVPRCNRRLRAPGYPAGYLPDGSEVLVCEGCVPVSYTAAGA